MELRDAILGRKSVRAFKEEIPSIQTLEGLIHWAGRGPSAGAIRGFSAIITKEKLFYDAPYHVAIFADIDKYYKRYGDRGRDLYAVQDATIFAAYLQLLLVEAELSSVWIGAFREDRVKALFKTDLRPVAVLAVGFKA